MDRRDAIVNVTVALSIVAVIVAAMWFAWSIAQANNEKSTQTQLACIEAGGTWVGGAATCVVPTVKVVN